jgi:tetratricopeptide (TPR) repeat protein
MTPTTAPAAANAAAHAPALRVGRWLSLLGCLLLATAVYLPALLRAQFLGFDDPFFFGPDNPEFQRGLLAVLDPRTAIANVYLPVAHASLWLDWKVFAGAPLGPHLVSMVLHGLCGFVLLRWLLRLGIAAVPAHVAVALFLLHPALVESVAWVSSRKDVLCGLFVFLALRETAVFAERPARGRLVGIAALTVLAMYSKATAVVLPLLALLSCLWLSARSPRRWQAPLVMLLCVLPIAWHHQVLAVSQGTMSASGTLAERLPQVPGAFSHYLQKTFWPVGLNVLYPEVKTLEAFAKAAGRGLAVLAGVGTLILLGLCWRATRAMSLGLASLVAALLPFNTAFPASSIAAADRYLYLAVPGAALAVAVVLAAVLRRGAVLGAVLALPLGVLAFTRAHAFEDDLALWQSSLATDADNAVAQLNLAVALQRTRPGELELLRAPLEAAAKSARYPIHALRAHQALAELCTLQSHCEEAALHAERAVAAAERLYAEEPARRTAAEGHLLKALLAAYRAQQATGRPEAARPHFARAQQLAPELPAVRAFAASLPLLEVERELRAAAAAGKPVELATDDPRATAAIAELERALAEAPDSPELNTVRAQWESVRGEATQALKYYRRAIAADPDAADAWLGIVGLCISRGVYAEAEDYARRGLALCRDPRLRYQLGVALAQQGRLDDAIQHLEAYLAVRPKDRDAARSLARFLVGKALVRLPEQDTTHVELRRLVDRARELNPGEPKVHFVLGRMALDKRQFAAAVEHLERLRAAEPGYEEGRRVLVEALRGLGYERRLAGDDDGACSAFARLLELADAETDTSGVRQQMQALWRRSEARGVELLQKGERAEAVKCFRRCLAIDPDQHWAAWLLASALYREPGTDFDELERLCAQAVAWQRQHGSDRSRQVLLHVLVLGKLGRLDDARRLGSEYLAAPDRNADPEVLELLRKAVGG